MQGRSLKDAVCDRDSEHRAVVPALGVHARRHDERGAVLEPLPGSHNAQGREAGLGERGELERSELTRYLLVEQPGVQVENATHRTLGRQRREAVPERRQLKLGELAVSAIDPRDEDRRRGAAARYKDAAAGADAPVGEREQRFVRALELAVDVIDRERPAGI